MSINYSSDFPFFAAIAHTQKDYKCLAQPKIPNNLPSNISNTTIVQPNWGMPSTKGFKIASINLASLYKYIEQLGIYMLPKKVDILAINETRLDSSILNGEVSIPGYIPLKGKIEIDLVGA